MPFCVCGRDLCSPCRAGAAGGDVRKVEVASLCCTSDLKSVETGIGEETLALLHDELRGVSAPTGTDVAERYNTQTSTLHEGSATNLFASDLPQRQTCLRKYPTGGGITGVYKPFGCFAPVGWQFVKVKLNHLLRLIFTTLLLHLRQQRGQLMTGDVIV